METLPRLSPPRMTARFGRVAWKQVGAPWLKRRSDVNCSSARAIRSNRTRRSDAIRRRDTGRNSSRAALSVRRQLRAVASVSHFFERDRFKPQIPVPASGSPARGWIAQTAGCHRRRVPAVRRPIGQGRPESLRGVGSEALPMPDDTEGRRPLPSRRRLPHGRSDPDSAAGPTATIAKRRRRSPWSRLASGSTSGLWRRPDCW